MGARYVPLQIIFTTVLNLECGAVGVDLNCVPQCCLLSLHVILIGVVTVKSTLTLRIDWRYSNPISSHLMLFCINCCIRKLNISSSRLWDAVRDKVEESASSVICLQETKRETFDLSLIRKFAPRRFDRFDFIPSVGASGGILVIWNSSVFLGVVVDRRSFSITVCFS